MTKAVAQHQVYPLQHTIDTPYLVGPVHCYTAELHGELVLFDTGPPTEEAERFLQDHIDLKRLKHVIITHCHIDHNGQSLWLEQNSDAAIYLPYRDLLKMRHHDERIEKIYNLFISLGFQDRDLKKMREALNRGVIPPSSQDNYLVAEDDIPMHLGIEVLNCPGHSQSDLVFCGNGWAVTGDTLLRGIFQTPLLDIDFKDGGRFKNYQAYCSTIVKLATLRGKRILPGHRYTIENINSTILFYIKKVLYRARQLLPFFNRDCSIAEIIDQLFTRLSDPFHIYFKVSEIIFLQDFLEQPDKLRVSLEQIGLYASVAEDFAQITEHDRL
ncbi:MAG: MBL fold metallo-hydrolase [Desulfobacterales bacterium]|nr:MBL fold metallo-hydrolase [Deltaproteobacteria bacterium]MBT8362571.1 MBL fold metallo-hydrolase [Deltaproteobacteria bacterium]NNK96796.1 MBL fold metallo-hydrolase [Desulfobacterales bacterium]